MARTAATLIALCLVAAPAFAADGERDLQGVVELTFRDVSQDGSRARFNEDFDSNRCGVAGRPPPWWRLRSGWC